MSEKLGGAVSSSALRHIRILNSLDDETLTAIAEQCQWSRCDASREVVTQETASNEVYFVCSGRVSAKIYSEKGKEITFAELNRGDTFGELAALDGQPRSSSVVALDETLLASLSAPLFNQLLNDSPSVMRALMMELAKRLRDADEKLFEFSALNTGNRIHAELLRLARSFPTGPNQANIAPAPTHADLASRTNSTRESVTRALNSLKKKGIIDASRQAITILDLEALATIIRDSDE
ncbi:MAG: Crp/Fnr family transcriptional regulator [Arenicellales bacterium]